LVELTREVSDKGDLDGGMPPFERYEAAGSVGFLV
jgi:hypothetical protein